MKRSTLLFTSAVVLAFSLGGSARADLINWTYSWQRNPVSVAADGNGTGGVSFTNQANTVAAAGNSDIVATNLNVFSTASPSNPDQLISNGAYSLTLTLTDSASGQAGTLTFTGKLTGTFSASNSDLTNVFTSASTQTLDLGGNTYKVTIGPFSPPGPPLASSTPGSIAAHVEVTSDSGGGVGVQDVPEPSTMLLAGLGGLSFLGAAWRKRRQPLAK
jgi:PEP-CTERM motif